MSKENNKVEAAPVLDLVAISKLINGEKEKLAAIDKQIAELQVKRAEITNVFETMGLRIGGNGNVGRPKMTEDEKKAAQAKRDALKNAEKAQVLGVLKAPEMVQAPSNIANLAPVAQVA